MYFPSKPSFLPRVGNKRISFVRPIYSSRMPDAEVQGLLDGVNEWLTLQAQEVTVMMAALQSDHLQLLSELDCQSFDNAVTERELVADSQGDVGLACPTLALASSPPPAPSIVPTSPARETRTEEIKPTGSLMPAHGFSAIETVLATRRCRLSRWEAGSGSAAAPRALLFGDAPLPPAVNLGVTAPPIELTSGASSGGWLQRHLDSVAELRAGLHRWRRGASGARLRQFRALGTAVAQQTAPRLALRAALRHLAAWRRAALAAHALLRSGGLHALRSCWMGWLRQAERDTARHSSIGSATATAAHHLRRARLTARLRAWRRVAGRARGLDAAGCTVHTNVLCRQNVEAMRCWCAWLRRRATWRRGAQRRAEAHGGWVRQHLPCMRGFDGRAAFMEEGSSGLVNAYRRRRGAAVALCAWRALAIGLPVADAGVQEDEPDDVLSDREWELDTPPVARGYMLSMYPL
jgi:hypothetical protein